MKKIRNKTKHEKVPKSNVDRTLQDVGFLNFNSIFGNHKNSSVNYYEKFVCFCRL
jgi:hypothetical protein